MYGFNSISKIIEAIETKKFLHLFLVKFIVIHNLKQCQNCSRVYNPRRVPNFFLLDYRARTRKTASP
jgi:hypothetical protein